MKTKFFLFILALALSYTASAQFPNFIKVDTGALCQLWGGHVKSTCFDMDNDGDLDIASSNNGVFVPIGRIFSLFKNERNGFYVKMPQFIDSTDFRNVRSFGDIDNDGDIDLFRGSMNGNQMKYYTNDGYGTFQYNTLRYLIWNTSYPSLLDFNNDGYLDVLGINLKGSVIMNNGNGGFLPTTNLGLFQPQEDVSLHSVSWGDPDNDGDLDFYGGYSSSGGNPINVCYLNNGNGEFVQFDPSSVIVQDTCDTPCVNWVDYDNDGDMDLYVQNMRCAGSLSALYENLGDMQFTKHVIEDEIYRYSFTISSVWGDLDNDADLDLFITVENNEFPWPPYDTSATPYNVVYVNDGNGQFTNLLDHPLTLEDTHTALLFDHDNDGDLDVLMSRYSWSNDGYNNLYVNEGNDNSWIVLTCEGTVSNRSAIGTRVQAKTFVNGTHITQTREITPINGHLSFANLRVHFGLGDAEVIDTLLIRWPSGIVDTYFDVRGKRFYRAIEDSGLVFLCPQGDISFTTQEEIDNFPVDNPDCVEIAGNVTISGSNITNLDGLLYIEVFGGNLEISGNDSLTDLTGLNNITLIEGSLHIHNNEMLTNCTGLDSLLSIGGDLTIGGDWFMGNNLLQDLTGLDNLTNIVGSLNISHNPVLKSLTGLEALTSIGGSLVIGNCNAKIEKTHGNSKGNSSLKDLSGLSNLSSIGESIIIECNDSLISLTGLEKVTSIEGELMINANENLSSLSGLENVTSIENSVDIGGNISLSTLSGLAGLTSIGGDLEISSNYALTSLMGLENLTSIAGNILIHWNDALISLAGLDNVEANTIIDLDIFSNPSLSNCEARSICHYLDAPGGEVHIFDNAIGCNSPEEVQDSCDHAGYHDIWINNDLMSIFPNPANVELNISAEGHSIDEVIIYTIAGQKVFGIRPENEIVNISNLPPGMYIIEASVENRKIRQKLVIQ